MNTAEYRYTGGYIVLIFERHLKNRQYGHLKELLLKPGIVFILFSKCLTLEISCLK